MLETTGTRLEQNSEDVEKSESEKEEINHMEGMMPDQTVQVEEQIELEDRESLNEEEFKVSLRQIKLENQKSCDEEELKITLPLVEQEDHKLLNEKESKISLPPENYREKMKHENVVVKKKSLFKTSTAPVMLPRPSGVPFNCFYAALPTYLCNSSDALATSSNKKCSTLSTAAGCQVNLLCFSSSDEEGLKIASNYDNDINTVLHIQPSPLTKKIGIFNHFAPHALLLVSLLGNNSDNPLFIENLLSRHIIPTWKTLLSGNCNYVPV